MRPVVMASPPRLVCAVFSHTEHVQRGEASVPAEAGPDAPVYRRTKAADVLLLLTRDAQHNRRVRLLGEHGWNGADDGSGGPAAVAASRVFADEHDIFHVEPHPPGDGRDRLNGALRAGVHVQLAIAPVCERRARLEHVVLVVWRGERLVEDEVGALESRLDVPEGPLVLVRARRQPSLVVLGEVRFGPLQLLDVEGSRRLLAAPAVAVGACVGLAGAKGHERIDHERQRLEVDLDGFDGSCRRLLVGSRHRHDRLAGIDGLVAERSLALGIGGDSLTEIRHDVGRRRELRRPEDRAHPRHGLGGAGVYAPDPGMGKRAQQKLCVEHPVHTEVLRVLRPARDLGDEVGCRIVLTNLGVVSHGPPPAKAPRPVPGP